MAGSAGVASFIALWGFWVLLALGIARGELGLTGNGLPLTFYVTTE